MLNLRIEGDLAEAQAFVDAVRAAGVEVQTGTTKDRGDFVHVYAMARVPGYTAAAPARPARRGSAR